MDCLDFKLGKQAAKKSHGLPLLAAYIPETVPEPPESVDWSGGRAYWGMMQNDRLGCCTAAGAAHAVQVWTQNAAGAMFTAPDQDVVSFYEASTGYNPLDPDTDQGGVAADVLKYWLGNGLAGHKIDAIAHLHDAGVGLNPLDDVNLESRLRDSIWLTGGAYLGLELPATAPRQALWSITDKLLQGPSAPGSWGGHCVYACTYSPAGVTCITWGILKFMTWEFVAAYCSEGFALLSKDWLNSSGSSPSGFNWQLLLNDMQLLRE